ncbi:MAG: riboflavin synthase, partial [Treponema sp.]|nr:riboflavin synthase [Treponema sp.]
MFTGIVEAIGILESVLRNGNSMRLSIACPFAAELEIGESVAVNGICLTVASFTDKVFSADVTPETFRRTALVKLNEASYVNLERAMKADGRFGGHIVTGHVDGCGKIINSVKEDNAFNVTFKVDGKLFRYIIEKGSVAIDGISLTVASVKKNADYGLFSVSVIPHTWNATALKLKNSGDLVNIECDMIGKY